MYIIGNYLDNVSEGFFVATYSRIIRLALVNHLDSQIFQGLRLLRVKEMLPA